MVLSMERWIGQVAVVTGASSGIGAAIAERLVQQGLKVVGMARRLDRLEELAVKLGEADGQFYPLQVDMTIENDILAAFDWVKENLGPLHILINNAGCAVTKRITESTTEDWNGIMQVNVIGLLVATKEAVKIMKEHDISGHIININSVLGHYIYHNIPHANIYPASKHAVTALTESLRLEFIDLDLKIKISSVSPGLVDTEILSDLKSTERYEQILAEEAILTTEDVNDAVIYILSTPPSVQVHDLIIRARRDILGSE